MIRNYAPIKVDHYRFSWVVVRSLEPHKDWGPRGRTTPPQTATLSWVCGITATCDAYGCAQLDVYLLIHLCTYFNLKHMTRKHMRFLNGGLTRLS